MPTLHFILLGGFLLVTLLLLATSSGGLGRAPDVHLYWRDARAHSIPLPPAIFIGMMVLLTASALVVDLGMNPWLPGGYLLGGVIWMLASMLTPAVVATHHGVIVHHKRNRHRIAWRQIEDYFRFDSSGRSGYVLFYTDRQAARRRVEISVPARNESAFSHLLSKYVDARLESLPEESFGGSTLEG